MKGPINMLLSHRVIEAITDHTRTDQADLPTPLAEVIDSDALDCLIPNWRVFHTCRIL